MYVCTWGLWYASRISIIMEIITGQWGRIRGKGSHYKHLNVGSKRMVPGGKKHAKFIN